MFRGVNMRGAQIYIKKTESGGGGCRFSIGGVFRGCKNIIEPVPAYAL